MGWYLSFSSLKSSLIFLSQIVTVVRAAGPAAVPLGSAGTFVVLAKSGVSTVPQSIIDGNVGVSPAASSSLTGFSLIRTGTFAASLQVVGEIFAADFTSPTPSQLTTAVLNMQTAFADAANRVNPNFLNLGSGKFAPWTLLHTGNIGGLTLTPGLYKWTNSVSIPSTLTISGTSSDTWIFQVAGGLSSAAGVRINLAGGASASNIVWVVSGSVTLGSTSHFEGILLGATSATLETGATMNGRVLVQTAAALQKATLIQP
ncbi:antifreeze protein [Stereum hirsutum FP-91666 SS1]|uniref:antifreeze protein n=1 Tax=Stereum hirsutum (strain FP-91666) TaxID=721885 RepID=UPI000441055E|nr:antifreeze protein [Stereum hirsutum FP-91666 SS1]EIM91118.1 antifreeze protein [Stereum hirsutum FP-91666 SS1]